MDNQNRKSSVALLSVVSNTALVVLKLIIGLIIGSVSVISEAIHSGVDLVAAIIALFAVRTSGKPADKDHPFGHGKYENVSGTAEALLIFLAAAWIIFEAVKKLAHPEPMKEAGLGVAIMLVSAIANIIVSKKLFKIGKETDSVALQADAWHLRTDVYTSAGVMLGLLIITIGRFVAPRADLQWIDPIAAIAVALLIIKAAYDLTVQSAKDLLDISLPPEEEEAIRASIISGTPNVLGFHKLRTRKSGSDRFVDLHLLVSPEMSVNESHEITEIVTDKITQQFSGCTVTIHVEPCDGNCTADCSENCLLSRANKPESNLKLADKDTTTYKEEH